MDVIKKYLFSPFKNDWKLLLCLSIPALLLGAFGLNQLGRMTTANLLALEGVKLACEFLFLGALLSLLHLLGVKNKWVLAAVAFVYYLTMTADLILLWYFKERFGAKYLNTMEGGDYDFLKDWRVISYFLVLAAFCIFAAKRYFQKSTRKTAISRLAVCLLGLGLLYTANPLKLLPRPDNFYTSYLVPPSVVYTVNAVLAKRPQAHQEDSLSAPLKELAQEYNVFSAKNTPAGKKYTRVILIASESLSNKYLHRVNGKIPPQASAPLDKLMATYPAASLQHVTLSTLYGLTVIFTSHPYAQLAYENGYPVSFVKELKKQGFHTAFLRGANETYMDENILFKQAGFDEVIGATYFETRPEYKEYIDWWGLTDRQLFKYAGEYLQEHQKEPLFMTILTVDSHVPLGRLDYLGQEYEEIDAEFYNIPTLPRAFARFGQDVKRFLADLNKRGLFDENTLILVTADHPSYSNTPTNKLFKPYQAEFDNLPFIIITKTPIKAPLADNKLISQLDIAPTVLDLLQVEPPSGFFGHSLFDTAARRSIFDIKEDYAVVTTDKEKRVFPLNSQDEKDKALIHLMTTFLVK
ncbi:LTA synthase family protein [Candidatus Avelusimicrobium sp.]|uniref:LTA synthase family protein n=1 Tax=Candidatus Avelusimicrobium sp. TaxID=3048833 RepID=UPI003D7CCD96